MTDESSISSDAQGCTGNMEIEIKKKFEQEALEAHNRYRALHGSPKMILNRELCDLAQKWVDHLVEKNIYEHSKKENRQCSKGSTGENLHKSRNKRQVEIKGSASVDSWYKEISNYEFADPGFSMTAGHFTQVVWEDSIEMGIAFKTYHEEARYRTVVVANYYPAGNVVGEFDQKVKPPKAEKK